MVLNIEILKIVKSDNRLKHKIAHELDVSEQTLYRYLRENNDNGELTKKAVINIISETLQVPEEDVLQENLQSSEILI
jgi:transposase